jgi:hypothetical protein
VSHSYYVVPINDEEVDRATLEELGVTVPWGASSRHPTPREVCDACCRVAGVRVEVKSRPGTIMRVMLSSADDDRKDDWVGHFRFEPFSGDVDQPQRVVFDYGPASLAIPVVLAVAHTCGPLLLWPPDGRPPLLIEASASVGELVDRWSKV